jgi:large repetitive protein
MDGRGTCTNAIRTLLVVAVAALVLAVSPLANATAQAEISIASPSGGYVATHTPTFEGVTDDILDDVTLDIYAGTHVEPEALVQTLSTVLPPTGGTWSLEAEALADGTYTAQASQTNTVGETSSSEPPVTFHVDTTKPEVSLDPVPSPTNDATPSLAGHAGTAEGDVESVIVNVYEGGSASGSPVRTLSVTPTGGAWSTSVGPALGDGTYTAQAEQSDEAGNTGESTTSTFTVDTALPAVSLTPVGSPTNDSSPSFGGGAGVAAGDIAEVTLKIYPGSTPSGIPIRTTTVTPSDASWSATLASALGDGTYTAQAEQSNEAGSTGKSAPSTFTVDTTKPTVQISSPANGSFISASKPTISGTAGSATGDQATVTVNVYSGSTVSASPAQTLNLTRSGGSWTTGTSGPQLQEGTYTLQAEQSDEAGNTGVSSPTTFTIKTKAPAVSLTPPTTPTNNPTPSFGGAAGNAAGDIASVTLKIYSGTTASGSPLRTLSIATSGATWATGPVTALADGTYTAQAEQSDEASDTGFSAPSTFTIDTTKPTVHISSPAGGAVINATKPTISGTAGSATGDQATVTVNVYSGSSVSGTPAQTLNLTRSGGSWTTGTSGPQLKEGIYTLQAQQSDEAGNTGFSTPPTTFTINTKSPAVSLASQPTPTNDSTPSFGGAAGTGPGDDASVTLKIFSGASATGSALRTLSTATKGAATWALGPIAALADGTYTAQAEQGDEAGNPPGKSTPSTFIVDTVKPAVTLSPGSSERHTSKPIFTGSAGVASGDLAAVTLNIYSGKAATGSPARSAPAVLSGGKWTAAPSAGLANGTYTAQAEQRDEAGNIGRSQPATFIIVSSGPVVTLTPIAKVSNESSPSFGGSAGDAAGDTPVLLKVYSGTSPSASKPVREVGASPVGGTWSTGPIEALTDGTYTALAEQSDSLKNTGVSAETTFTVDTAPPTLTLTSPDDGSSAGASSVSVQGAAGTAVGDAPTVSVKLIAGSNPEAGPLQTRIITVEHGQWEVTFDGLAPGTYTTRAEQSDEAGNTGRAGPVTFTVVSPVSASFPQQPPAASFTWQPSVPHTGEPVSLLSSSTDPSSPLTGFAWDLLGTGPFNAGPPTIRTSFSTPGNHLVRLRVVAADGLSSVAAETIPVIGPALPLMRPFPVVRIVSTDTVSGIKLKLLRVLAPAGARIGVICRNRGCPVKSLAKVASAKAAVSAYTFPRLQRPLRAGVVLEVRVSKGGQIGKYTRLVVRRGRLPQRLDLCLDSAGVKPIACPAS